MTEPSRVPARDEQGQRLAVLRTYRYLRVSTLVEVAMLVIAVARQIVSASGCIQTSISAYYFTAAHSVFVAALCVIGAALIVYKGSTDTEDVVLNFSGFLAFVVAFVPTSRESVCSGPQLPSGYDVSAGISNNVLALFIAGAAAEAVRVHLARRETGEPLGGGAHNVLVLGWGILAAFVVAFVVARSFFEATAHSAAAVILFAGIIYVVLLNARSSRAVGNDAYVRRYQMVAWLMGLTLLAVVALHFTVAGFNHVVIVAEVLLIGEFALFWAVQTAELWHVIDKDDIATQRGLPPLSTNG